MKRLFVFLVGAVCGLAWWAISAAFGVKTYGILGTHALTGIVSGACTGILVTTLSIPIYRRISLRGLLWYSPLSVYLAIAVYGLIVFVIRSLTSDFHPGQIPGAVGVESVLGMWWGVTVLAPIGIPIQLLAYANHRLLRRLYLPRTYTTHGATVVSLTHR